jgi:50S ribosomal subunit-associated GTPase HflX
LNKIDRVPEARRAALAQSRPDALLASARSGEGLDGLKAALTERLELNPRPVRLRFRAEDARGIATVYSTGRVTAHEIVGDEVRLEAEIPGRLLGRYRHNLA